MPCEQDMSCTLGSLSGSDSFDGVTVIPQHSFGATETLRSIADAARSEYLLLYTKAQPLQFDETGLIGKGKYLVKQAKGKDKQSQYFRSFYSSKNLVHPQPRKRDGRFSQRKVRELCADPCDRAAFERLYEGYAFAEAAEYYNDVNSGFYLEIRLYKKAAVARRRL